MKIQPLRIIKKLPQIVLPADKNEMFIEWYDEDLRFLDEIPKSFERGYLFIENNFYDVKVNISEIAKQYKTTYRRIENMFKEFSENTKNTILYFEFEGSSLRLDLYLKEILNTSLTIRLDQVDSTKPNPRIEDRIAQMYEDKAENFNNIYIYYCSVLLIASLWYIATATKPTKYYREGKNTPFYYEKKEIINPKKEKTISTPIYDMAKIRKVKTEGLIKRRKGWTYSYSFQVHGHYRHYANGKTIFIEPFIKGKGKEEINQRILINPKELKQEIKI